MTEPTEENLSLTPKEPELTAEQIKAGEEEQQAKISMLEAHIKELRQKKADQDEQARKEYREKFGSDLRDWDEVLEEHFAQLYPEQAAAAEAWKEELEARKGKIVVESEDPLVMTATGPAAQVFMGYSHPTPSFVGASGNILIGSKSGHPPFPLPTAALPEGPFVDEAYGIMRHNYRPDSPLNQIKENISRHRLQQAHGKAYHEHAFKCRERDAERISRAGGRWSY